MKLLRGLNVVSLTVTDLARASDFYSNVLGLGEPWFMTRPWAGSNGENGERTGILRSHFPATAAAPGEGRHRSSTQTITTPSTPSCGAAVCGAKSPSSCPGFCLLHLLRS